jgi:hypothetical protein
MINDKEDEAFYRLAEDMERNPEMYKEYVEEISQVAPDYPSHGTYMIVDHQAIPDMGGERPCFISIDEAVSWAEYNLQHNNYNVYELKVVM